MITLARWRRRSPARRVAARLEAEFERTWQAILELSRQPALLF